MKKLLIGCLVVFPMTLISGGFDAVFYGRHGEIVGEEYWLFDDKKKGDPSERPCGDQSGSTYNDIIWKFDNYNALGTSKGDIEYHSNKVGCPNYRRMATDKTKEVSDLSKACISKGHKQLKDWLADENSTMSKYLKLIDEIKGITSFYLWVNDYHTYKSHKKGLSAREASVWYWDADDLYGFIKYEVTILPDGTCEIPQKEKVFESMENIIFHQEKKNRENMNFVKRIFNLNRAKKLKKKIEDINPADISNVNDQNGSRRQ